MTEVASTYCPGCGAPVPAGAQFCSYCGRAIPTGAAPLPSAPTGVSPSFPSTPPEPPYGRAPPAPRRRRVGLIVVVLLVVVLLVAGVAVFDYFEAKPPPIQVAFINIWAPDNVCGLNANPIAYYGFNSSTSSPQTLDFGVPNYNLTACTIHGVSTNTTGFSLSAIEVPLTIPGNGTGSMNITITPPASAYSGNMNLVLV